MDFDTEIETTNIISINTMVATISIYNGHPLEYIIICAYIIYVDLFRYYFIVL